jgi:hypothetical protein
MNQNDRPPRTSRARKLERLFSRLYAAVIAVAWLAAFLNLRRTTLTWALGRVLVIASLGFSLLAFIFALHPFSRRQMQFIVGFICVALLLAVGLSLGAPWALLCMFAALLLMLVLTFQRVRNK